MSILSACEKKKEDLHNLVYKKKMPMVLLIHSLTCGACKNLMPTWNDTYSDIVKLYPHANNEEELNTPLVASLEADNMDILDNIYLDTGYVDQEPVQTDINEVSKYVPTILKIRYDGDKVVSTKYDGNDRTKESLINFYKTFKDNMVSMSGGGGVGNNRYKMRKRRNTRNKNKSNKKKSNRKTVKKIKFRNNKRRNVRFNKKSKTKKKYRFHNTRQN